MYKFSMTNITSSILTAKKHAKEKYTDYELSYVSEYNNFAMVTIEKYKNDDGTTDRVVSSVIYTATGKEVKNVMYVVDEGLNILYSTEHQDKKKLTRREYDLLTRNATSKYVLSKCNFKDDEGNKRTLLAFSPKTIGNDLKRMRQAFLALIIEFFCSIYFIAAAILPVGQCQSKKTAQTAQSSHAGYFLGKQRNDT